MAGRLLQYDPERLRALELRTSDVIAHLAETNIDDPAATAAMQTIRSIAFALSTTWMPVLARVGADASMTSWSATTSSSVAGSGRGARTTSGIPASLVPPIDDGPDEVAAWWSALGAAERRTLIDDHPHLVGNTDGIPASARDEANRRLMAADLERLEQQEAADALSAADAQILDNIRATRAALDGDPVSDPISGEPVASQLYIYEPAAFGGDGRIAIAVGDLDRAHHVAVIVTGLGSDASRISTEKSRFLHQEASWASSDRVAVLAWTGYDAPSFSPAQLTVDDLVDEGGDLAGVLDQDAARAGAVLLARDVAGLNAARGDDDEPHVTVVGNSYGSTTAAIAADEFGLEADDLILTGSPGAGDADSARDLITGAEHTWVGSASSDVVTYLGETGGWVPQDTIADVTPAVGQLGDDPAEDSFGANRFAAEGVNRPGGGAPGNVHDHGLYFTADSESLYNIAAVVVGEYGLVMGAAGRHMDPFVDDLHIDLGWPPVTADVNYLPDDPEAARRPTAMTHET